MAVDQFLKIAGVEGESKDAKHAKEIDVLAWSWGMSQSGSFHSGGGGGSGKASFQDISITKWIDKSSADLMTSLALGKHFTEADLVVRKAGGTAPLEYIKIHIDKVLVTSISIGGSGGEDRLTENISLNFAKVKLEYFEQKDDGSGEAAKEFVFNIEENTA